MHYIKSRGRKGGGEGIGRSIAKFAYQTGGPGFKTYCKWEGIKNKDNN
jgi:hypothetical protein